MDQGEAAHPRRRTQDPTLAILHNACTVHRSRADTSPDRANLNIIRSETTADRPPIAEGVLATDGRPFSAVGSRYRAGPAEITKSLLSPG
jgi:hypothetical protein